MSQPTEQDARKVAEDFRHMPVKRISRFPTGNHHYVYDLVMEDGSTLVVRMTKLSEKYAMEGAVYLNGFFRAREVPLPDVYAHDLDAPFPWMLMERLPGRDLGDVFGGLNDSVLKRIAALIGSYQKIAAESMKPEKFGYAVHPHTAPYNTWNDIIEESLRRSRARIEDADLISPHYCDEVERLMCAANMGEVTQATPFFHDLTGKNVIVTDSGDLSGVVDVDDLCFGDPTYHLALTRVALARYPKGEDYIKYLLQSYDGYHERRLDSYTALFYLDFLSEIGQVFNGNIVNASPERVAFLQQSLEDCFV
ncbi:MAG: aminoglycoside phosphotransferase family protein [Alphaproteobacteria bacterium]|nr:aminoglycoside phosphotransferase family protein [Alphaproteobacteria bacterium]